MNQTELFLMKPKVDFCFKELMEDEEIRRGFLSALLDVRPEEIFRTELLPTILERGSGEDKLGILDVRVLLNGNVQIDMEIQIAYFPFWRERSSFYLSKLFAGQLKSGEGYGEIKKCIHVGILDFILFPEDKELYSLFHLWEDKRRRMYTDKLEIHVIELPKLAAGGQPETELLKWARFFNAEKKEEFDMVAKTDPYIDKAYERLMLLSADERKRLEYETREKAVRDYNTVMDMVNNSWKSGHEEGIKEGIKALVETCQELCLPKNEVCAKIMRRFSLSPEEADIYAEKYWRE